MKITTDKVRENYRFEGSGWYVTCPKCLKVLEVYSWYHPVCDCGYEWHVKIIGVGEIKESST